jgi:UDP-N-acetylglucosamine 2-epimerase (non-hydrolysing)
VKKILTVFGTRPEAIKMAPVIQALKKDTTLETVVCVTAQHRHMLDQVLTLFDITPDVDLNLMRPGQDLTDVSVQVLQGMRDCLRRITPDLVLVQGDTTTVFAAALASFYEKIPVGHVEAGLRTYNNYAPFPEEMNRRMASVLSTIHFAPTQQSKNNLIHEHINPEHIFVTGNTGIDSLFWMTKKLKASPDIQAAMQQQFSYLNPDKKLIVVTGHRRENFGEGFEQLCAALLQVAKNNDVEIVYPLHLNPNVREPVTRIIGNHPSIFLINPLPYLPFLDLLTRSTLIITDSGGVQEEAPSLGKPVLVTRNTTERPEAVDAGTVLLVGTDPQTIVDNTEKLLHNPVIYNKMAQAHNPYGDGHAAERIHQIITDFLHP